MGIDPARVSYLQLAEASVDLDEARIPMRGERWRTVRSNFALLPQFAGLRLA